MSRAERNDGHLITSRELEILGLIREGISSNKEIGKVLRIKTNTVKVHKNRLFSKLGIVTGDDGKDENKSIRAILIGIERKLIPHYLPQIDETQTAIYRDGMKALGLDQDGTPID